MQNVKLKALVPFKISLPMIWLLAPFPLKDYTKKTNTLKPLEMDYRMAFFIWGRPHCFQNGKLNILGYFLFFPAASLVGLDPESLNF